MKNFGQELCKLHNLRGTPIVRQKTFPIHRQEHLLRDEMPLGIDYALEQQ